MRSWLLRLALGSVLVLSASVASAEPDSFGIGDGHSGPKAITSADPATAGEVNSYAGVASDVAAGDTTVSITTTVLGAAFRANDLVMVWRATGVDASEAPSGNQTKRLDLSTALATTSSGNTLSAGLVGRYELARVASVTGSTLALTKPLVNAYTKSESQVVRVPEFTTVTVGAGAALRAMPWQEIGGDPATPNHANPWVGGILIFFANGAIQNDGTIHANERGFHGGTPVARNLNTLGLICDGTALDGDPTATAGSFAPKGEGVVASKFSAQSGGKGNISMAGGGGDCFESGGGGGANVGNGGVGSSTVVSSAAGGLGGVGIDYDTASRVTMGGGGGSGRHVVQVGLTATSELSLGGFGGGVVYVRGATMAGAGLLQANGGDGSGSGLLGLPSGVASEGSGGGGAGGTILVRLTGSLDCKAVNSNGGAGGNATVLGAAVLGAGGGGGGGRVFYQAASKTGTCAVTVSQGDPGNNGGGGATGGNAGGTTGITNPLCVATAPGVVGSCANPAPVCDPTSGLCAPCTGPFGGGGNDACPLNVQPVCLTTGACVPCNGDFNSGGTQACELAGSPTCAATTGACGKCSTDADCAGHPGPHCDASSGACGAACTKDEDCKQTEWCAPTSTTSSAGTCVPKVPNGQPLPAGPPIDNTCTPETGQRTCLSAVCEESDDLCGRRNSDPCPGGNAECRSSVCYPADQRCGLPNGQPCTADGICRSALCLNGTCVGRPCGSDPDCPVAQVCDPTTRSCVDGCRPEATLPSDGGIPNGVCTPPSTCGAPTDGGVVGTCNVGDAGLGDGGSADAGHVDAGDTAGLIEGGGCSCSSVVGGNSSPLAALAAAASALVLFRRRKNRRGSQA